MWSIPATNWNFLHCFPCETGRRKVRKISICRRNCSKSSCSYFDFPLGTIVNESTGSLNWIGKIQNWLVRISCDSLWSYTHFSLKFGIFSREKNVWITFKTTISYGFWNFPLYGRLGGKKGREIPKPEKYRGLENCSNIFLKILERIFLHYFLGKSTEKFDF